jgi:hypothetical protein
VSEAPPGWNGPIVLYEGPAPLPSCDLHFPFNVFEGGTSVSWTPAQCSLCTCSAPDPSGLQCGAGFDLGTDPQCANSPCGVWILANGCHLLNDPNCISDSSTIAGAQTMTAGAMSSCAPSSQAPTSDPATWVSQALACSAPTLDHAGCGFGQVCSPKSPGLPFGSKLCILNPSGDVACPGPYTEKHVYYADMQDDRNCTDCTCGAPEGFCTDTTWSFFDVADSMCSNPVATTTTPGQCLQIPSSSSSIRYSLQLGTPTGAGACPESGGDPVGSVVPIAPATVCCEP